MRSPASPGFLACVVLVMAATSPVDSWARDTTEKSGDIIRLAIPAAALALTVKRKDRTGRRQFYRAFGSNLITTAGLKAAVDKDRPDGSDDDAFPSGHTSTAFQGAAFIHRRYGFRDAWIAYVFATYVGWTRIDADKHDETDVLAGAAIGIASSFLLTDRLQRQNFSLAAIADGDMIGITIQGKF